MFSDLLAGCSFDEENITSDYNSEKRQFLQILFLKSKMYTHYSEEINDISQIVPYCNVMYQWLVSYTKDSFVWHL